MDDEPRMGSRPPRRPHSIARRSARSAMDNEQRYHSTAQLSGSGCSSWASALQRRPGDVLRWSIRRQCTGRTPYCGAKAQHDTALDTALDAFGRLAAVRTARTPPGTHMDAETHQRAPRAPQNTKSAAHANAATMASMRTTGHRSPDGRSLPGSQSFPYSGPHPSVTAHPPPKKNRTRLSTRYFPTPNRSIANTANRSAIIEPPHAPAPTRPAPRTLQASLASPHPSAPLSRPRQ